MEEMSKKTKRLEKENLTLTRKNDQTSRNILEMAEERTRYNEELEKWRKKSSSLEALCRRMQQQGRGQGMTGESEEVDDEGTESEYDDEYEDEEEDLSEDGEYDDQDHGEHQHTVKSAESEKPVFGPPPPPTFAEARANGNKALVNVKGGVKTSSTQEICRRSVGHSPVSTWAMTRYRVISRVSRIIR
jgi:hypothetical protein